MPTAISKPQSTRLGRNVSSETLFDSSDTIGPRSSAVLMLIGSKPKGQMTVREIADFFDMSYDRAREVVARIRSRGLVSYYPVAQGRRDTPVRLLEAGRRALQHAAECSVGSQQAGLCLTGVPRRR